MNIRTRKARPDEAAVLTALSIRSKQSNGYDDDFMKACEAELTITTEDFSSIEYWVAEGDGICGVIGLSVYEEGVSGEVSALFVKPNLENIPVRVVEIG